MPTASNTDTSVAVGIAADNVKADVSILVVNANADTSVDVANAKADAYIVVGCADAADPFFLRKMHQIYMMWLT